LPNLIFITHPEVLIDPAVPVPEWPLSPVGRSRMERFAQAALLSGVRSIYASGERKAQDGAEILSAELGHPVRSHERLGENDRSATGYIAPPEFWEVVDAFFSRPTESIRGWERAVDAQERLVTAVREIGRTAPDGDVAIVAHGGVGSLLLAHLRGAETARDFAQPHGGGGCLIVIDREAFVPKQGWQVIEDFAPAAI
jgi:broad specificity phosphatase PhoE